MFACKFFIGIGPMSVQGSVGALRNTRSLESLSSTMVLNPMRLLAYASCYHLKFAFMSWERTWDGVQDTTLGSKIGCNARSILTALLVPMMPSFMKGVSNQWFVQCKLIQT